MLVKLNLKNQITLPKSITSAVAATDCFDVQVCDGQIVLTPMQVQRSDAVRDKLVERRLSESDIAAAVAWSRKTLCHREIDSLNMNPSLNH
jgi:hypothetical protein